MHILFESMISEFFLLLQLATATTTVAANGILIEKPNAVELRNRERRSWDDVHFHTYTHTNCAYVVVLVDEHK